MLSPTEGEDGRHGLAGPKTAVALGAKDGEMPGRLARMRTAQAQAAARARILLLRDSGETPDPVAGRVGRTSAEARRHPPCVPGRLGFVSAPGHGSWPDLVEGLCSRTARQMLRGIRVSSKDEPEERILRYLEEASAEPVACRWRWNLSDVDPTTEELVVDTLLPDEADKAS